MNAIQTWYSGLNGRERNMVTVLGIMMIILILFIAIVMPIRSYMAELSDSVERAQSELPEIASKVQALKSRSGGKQVNASRSLNQLITTSSKRYGLKFSRIEERKRNEEIQVRLDDVEFDQLLRWATQLEQQQGLVIDTLRVSDTDVVGMVDASIKFIKPT
ncbi:type II secretion system protein GspM [Kangiella sediminilitoris]|uniref:Type II secretion system protein M n=1 Tax=Kangiella sediminilitoris TaxID=1144748 RepID=A0A1B3B8A6_9GAMM|nr:type II secretion system protein M [Kangiella sediminilitoris]AOE49027.1 Type II secretion system protein M [Kangiella sediminilitoris]